MVRLPKHFVASVIGLVAGGFAGAIVAVNVIIFAGLGYDISIADVFDESLPLGVLTIALLLAGPPVGVVVMRTLARGHRSVRRDDAHATTTPEEG